jgi:ACS family D-galactonate transporter-like MFS transporter
VALTFVFMLINYADKAVVGLSSVPIMKELRLSNTEFGLLGSAFFLLFSVSGILVGFLANRVRTRALMLIMALVWVAALLPVSLVSSFALLLVSRVMLGAAEGPAFPVALHSVYKWFPDRLRALPTSVVACGAAVGTGVVAPLLTWIILQHGWHTAFGVLALLGSFWAGLWFLLAREGPIDILAAASATALRVPYTQLLLSRTALGVFLAGFGAYWIIALNLVWLANYLNKGLHFAPATAAGVIVLPSLTQMVLAPAAAALSQRLHAAGMSSRIARGALGAGCVMLAGMTMVVMALVDTGALKIVLIGLSFAVGSVIFTLGSALIGEISPPAQRGAMLGITNSVHTLAGLCAPVLMGLIVDVGTNPSHGFRAGFIYAGVLVAGLGALACVLINPEADLARFHIDVAAQVLPDV